MGNLLKVYLAAQAIHKQINQYETSGWKQAEERGPLRIDDNPQKTFIAVINARLEICHLLLSLTEEERDNLDRIEEIHTASGRLRGVLYGQSWSEEEQAFVLAQKTIFEQNWKHTDGFTAFTILSFYYQPFELSLQTDVSALKWAQLHRYLHFVMRQPHIMQETDEVKYIECYKKLTKWLLELIEQSDSKKEWAGVPKLISTTLTFGSCYYIDHSIADLVSLRTEIIQALTKRFADFKELSVFNNSSKPAENRNKLRLGIISRNIGDYTDTRALYAMFHSFDPALYEIYWYSLDVIDATTLSDVHFFRQLYSFIHKAVSLRGSGAAMAQQVLNDDLDILAIGSAFSFGAQTYDQMLSCKMARVQIGLNAMVPGNSDLPSYDYYLVTEPADAEAMANYRSESQVPLKIVPDPLVCYEKPVKTQPKSNITRYKLGIPDDAIIYCSGAAANKQMPETLRTWLNILQQVPSSYLLLYPFNPAWGGYFIGLTLLARLNALLKEYPEINRERIVIARQVTPEEGNQLIMLGDIYLGSFPHGGATSAMLALRYDKPVVARRSPWLRGTSDPSLLKSMNLEELIGRNNEEVTAIAVRLGLDANYRRELSRNIAGRVENAPFFDIVGNSKNLQAVFDQIAEDHGLLPSNAATLKVAG